MSNRSAGSVPGGNDGSVYRGSRGNITTFRYNKGMRANQVRGGSSKYANTTVAGNLTQLRSQKFNDRAGS